jgi:hypothetical protein
VSVRGLRKQIEELSQKRGISRGPDNVPTCELCGTRADAILKTTIEDERYPEDDPRRYSDGEVPCFGCRELDELGLRPGVGARVFLRTVPPEAYEEQSRREIEAWKARNNPPSYVIEEERRGGNGPFFRG